MPLDETIENWPREHDRAIRDIVRTFAFSYRSVSSKKFPNDFVVIGHNWFYIGELNYLNGKDISVGKNFNGDEITLEFSEAFTINSKQKKLTTKYFHLGKILKDFEEHLEGGFALFPATERRVKEARELGGAEQSYDDWFDVCYNGKKIKVFPLQPKEKAVYFAKINQVNIGYTLLDSSPLI